MGIETCGFVTKCWKMHCCDYIKVPRCCGSLYNILVFCGWELGIVMNRVYFALAPRPCFGAVFCNSVAADRNVMAASRFLTIVVVCEILCCFAAESRESYWSGWFKVVLAICQRVFWVLVLVIFLLFFLSVSWKKHAAVDAGLYVSDGETTINIRYIVVKFCCNAWISRVNYPNILNIIWSRSVFYIRTNYILRNNWNIKELGR